MCTALAGDILPPRKSRSGPNSHGFGRGGTLDLAEIKAVIDSAKARGPEPLERFIRHRLSTASEAEIQDAVEVATEIIDTVPLFMARAQLEAAERNLTVVVAPLLEHAYRYFLQPMDLIPEMTHGLAGLLDDTYLVLRILQNLQNGPEPLVDWDLEYPAMFIRRLVGEKISRELDVLAVHALQEVSDNVSRFWNSITITA